MNKILITVVIILVIIFGIFFFLKNPEPAVNNALDNTGPTASTPGNNAPVVPEPGNNKPAPAPAPVVENVVTFTDSGYSPAELTVAKGATVRFKNASTLSVWTASAKHPTHTVYPTTGGCLGSTFDACKGILPGESWSFKFDVAGTWAYHDHLHPTFFGKIIVTG